MNPLTSRAPPRRCTSRGAAEPMPPPRPGQGGVLPRSELADRDLVRFRDRRGRRIKCPFSRRARIARPASAAPGNTSTASPSFLRSRPKASANPDASWEGTATNRSAARVVPPNIARSSMMAKTRSKPMENPHAGTLGPPSFSMRPSKRPPPPRVIRRALSPGLGGRSGVTTSKTGPV